MASFCRLIPAPGTVRKLARRRQQRWRPARSACRSAVRRRSLAEPAALAEPLPNPPRSRLARVRPGTRRHPLTWRHPPTCGKQRRRRTMPAPVNAQTRRAAAGRAAIGAGGTNRAKDERLARSGRRPASCRCSRFVAWQPAQRAAPGSSPPRRRASTVSAIGRPAGPSPLISPSSVLPVASTSAGGGGSSRMGVRIGASVRRGDGP